jgi:hypothetical protein
MIVTDLANHPDQHAQDGGTGLIFTSPEGDDLSLRVSAPSRT